MACHDVASISVRPWLTGTGAMDSGDMYCCAPAGPAARTRPTASPQVEPLCAGPSDHGACPLAGPCQLKLTFVCLESLLHCQTPQLITSKSQRGPGESMVPPCTRGSVSLSLLWGLERRSGASLYTRSIHPPPPRPLCAGPGPPQPRPAPRAQGVAGMAQG